MDRIAILVEWATRHGATLHPLVEVYDDAITGFSFRVKPSSSTSLQPYEPIVTIPSSLTLSYLTDAKPFPATPSSSHQPFSPAFIAQLPPHVIGRLILAREYLRGTDSFWYPYIQALPQPSDPTSWAGPPFWDADDVELLDGTNLEVGIRKIQADVAGEFAQATRAVSEHAPDSLLDQGGLTMQLYRWAYSAFSSRSFRPSLVLSAEEQTGLPEGVKADDFSMLLPLFDVGNHDVTAEIRWEREQQQEGKSSVSLRVGREHGAGQQVYNNYSKKTNAELLLGYGFMVPDTESVHCDYVHVRKLGAAAANDSAAANEYLVSLRPLGDSSSLIGRSKQPAALASFNDIALGAFQHVQADMVWDIVCAMTTAEQRAQLIPAESEEEQQRLFFSGRVDGAATELLEKTVAVIGSKVYQELERLEETEVEVSEEDKAALTRNQRLALEYRARVRRVLEATLEAMSAVA